MIPAWIRPLFAFAALYDIVLGVGLGLAFKPVMSRFGVALPNHDAYVQLPAAGNMPAMWTWFAWSDLAFAVAFVAAWRALGPAAAPRAA